MQLDTELIKKSIEESSQVVIMAHRNLDLDALGSSLGLYYLCKTLGKSTCLLVDDTKHEVGVTRGLCELKKHKINVKMKKYADLKPLLDEKTLLIIVDTHVPNLVQNEQALSIDSILVLDHHFIDDDKIPSLYEYIGSEATSTVGIVIELLQALDIYIHPYIASIMLAGIFVDTNGFFNKTNYKTYEGAAYLYKCEAQLKEIQYLLKEDIAKYNDRQQIIREAQIINNHFIIAVGHKENIYLNEDLAKISDTMLLFNDIEASFTVGRIGEDVIGVSARSLGNINIQQITEKFGGGGHKADAAAQIKGETIDNVVNKLKNIVIKLKGGV